MQRDIEKYLVFARFNLEQDLIIFSVENEQTKKLFDSRIKISQVKSIDENGEEKISLDKFKDENGEDITDEIFLKSLRIFECLRQENYANMIIQSNDKTVYFKKGET